MAASLSTTLRRLLWWVMLYFVTVDSFSLDRTNTGTRILPASSGRGRTTTTTTSTTSCHLYADSTDPHWYDTDRHDSTSPPAPSSSAAAIRNMDALLEWATKAGVAFAPGLQLVEDNDGGDWSVTTSHVAHRQGTSIMSIPNSLILRSDDVDGTLFRTWIEQQQQQQEKIMMESSSLNKVLPECLLMLRLLREVVRGKSSLWYPWIASLPRTFSTALDMDEVERTHLQRLAPDLLREHDEHWKACSSTLRSFLASCCCTATTTHPTTPTRPVTLADQQAIDLHYWLRTRGDPNVVGQQQQVLQWLFAVVRTRSWRTPDQQQAMLVPLGDLFNHHSGHDANIQPCTRTTTPTTPTTTTVLSRQQHDRLDLCLNQDARGTTEKQGLYLSYGCSAFPERFLVHFGFFDQRGIPYVDVQLVYSETWWWWWWWSQYWMDPTELVVSTATGVVSSQVWNAVLFQVLQERDPQELNRARLHFEETEQYDNDDEDDDWMEQFLQTNLDKWESVVAEKMKRHFQTVLDLKYPVLDPSEDDLSRHKNLEMIVRYNNFMRTTFLRALNHVNQVVEQTAEVRKEQLTQLWHRRRCQQEEQAQEESSLASFTL